MNADDIQTQDIINTPHIDQAKNVPARRLRQTSNVGAVCMCNTGQNWIKCVHNVISSTGHSLCTQYSQQIVYWPGD